MNIDAFSLPNYNEIPDIGLYLEQTVNYINEFYEPLGISITPSMVSNYVKKGYIEHPVKKKYYARHIAYLLFFLPVKQTLQNDNILELIILQQRTYTLERAYNYFSSQFVGTLQYLVGVRPELPEETGAEVDYAKRMMKLCISSVSNVLYLNFCIGNLPADPDFITIV